MFRENRIFRLFASPGLSKQDPDAGRKELDRLALLKGDAEDSSPRGDSIIWQRRRTGRSERERRSPRY